MRPTPAILTVLATLGCGPADGTDASDDAEGPIDTGPFTSCPQTLSPPEPFDLDVRFTLDDGVATPDSNRRAVVLSDPISSAAACEAICGGFWDVSGTAVRFDIDTCVVDALGDTDALSDTDVRDPAAGDRYRVTCDGMVTFVCEGRHHATLPDRAAGRGRTPVGAWLARAAAAEAGSVHAFRALAEELRHHGAPADLIARCLDAARDEVRHARDTTAAARAHGGTPEPARPTALPVRSLRDLAHENAVEGCVHETFAAAIAAWQACHAADPTLLALFAAITRDELRHAELAADLHAWACAVLDPVDAAAVEQARRDAWQALSHTPDPPVPDALGWPDAPTRRAMVAALAARLG